jgi:hypothetical protein
MVSDADYSNRIYFVDVAIPADKKRRRDKMHAVFDGSRFSGLGG